MQVDLRPADGLVVECSTRRGILLEAWAPRVEAMRFNDPAITRLTKKYDKEPAQILLRYSLQKVCEQIRRTAVQWL